jgi:hypothetical protein
MVDRFVESVKYLKSIKFPELMAIDEQCLNSLCVIFTKIELRQKDIMKYLIKKKMHALFSNLLNYLSSESDDFTRDSVPDKMLQLLLTVSTQIVLNSTEFTTL